MERGTFTRNARLTQHHAPIPGTGGYLIYKELMQWRGYPPIRYGHYNRNPVILSTAFFVFFHLPFIGLVGGMPTVSRGPVPLNSYRVSQINDLVKYFFGFF